ncbi:MAG TPA: glycoside hydrolase domain-containing protein [Gemmatimonadaceae bacterium]|nr:glycoside hydrolase domain-containing protein [Gemmatimonadaceae bacterium]
MTTPAVPRGDSIVGFPGFDIANYPGDAAMQAWKYPASPYYWVGYYLPAPCHRDTTWAGKRASLATMGWGVAPLYVGQQDFAHLANVAPQTARAASAAAAPAAVICSASLLSTTQGTAEAADAVVKLSADRFPDSTVVYLDVETVTTITPELLDYYRAWIGSVLGDGRYRAGVYAGKANAQALYDAAAEVYRAADRTDTPPFWVASGADFSLTRQPSDVGFSFAQVWQGMFNVSQRFNGTALTVDVDLAATRMR